MKKVTFAENQIKSDQPSEKKPKKEKKVRNATMKIKKVPGL